MTMGLTQLTRGVCVAVICFSTAWSLSFSAFNIKSLNPAEYNKQHVADSIPQILKLYDITLIQELRSDAEEVMSRIAADLHTLTGDCYSYVLSDRLGRYPSYKENYAYIWRNDQNFTVKSVVQYPDRSDDFEREPYIIRIVDLSLSIDDLVIIGAHIQPSNAVTELDKMIAVYNFTVDLFGTENILLAGDFNADCNYISNTKYNNLLLTTDTRFDWLIDKDADTTVKNTTDCAYDRFSATSAVKDAVVSGSVHIYDFETALGLSSDDAYDVSDHYPIGLTIE